MTLTLGQKIAMALVLMSAVAGGTAQLAPILGATAAAAVAGLASLAGTVLSGWMFIITGQSYQVQNVKDMALDPRSAQSGAAQAALVSATSAVVGSAAAGPAITREAKVALLDATANLPEVTGTIDVTDKSLAEETVSQQVKAV